MSDPGEGRRPERVPLRGDEAELFRDFNRQFVRTVQRRTDAPWEMVDDACAFAWQQFMRHQPDRDRNWRGWLVTTAEREAWRLYSIEAGHLSLSIEGAGGGSAVWDMPDRRDQVAIRTRLREALSALAEVPERRRSIKALQVTGFSYEEIAEMRGLTYTRVNRMLAEANAVLREEQGREAVGRVHASPRAARLIRARGHASAVAAIGDRAPAGTDGRSTGGAGVAAGSAGDRRLPARPRARSRRRSVGRAAAGS